LNLNNVVSIAGVLFLSMSGCAPPSEEDLAQDVAVEELTTTGLSELSAKAATANTNDGNVAGNVLDDNLATRWSGLGPNAYLTLDLGSKRIISAIDIAWYKGDTRKSSFIVSASTDGTSFTKVYSATSSGRTANYEGYDFADSPARYVRITVSSNSENMWASISDVRVYGFASTTSTSSTTTTHLFSDTFGASDGLITNEYAFWNPTSSSAVQSTNWEMNSGSLFRQSSTAWTGKPDATGPNATSSNGNDSVVFRMMTKRADFGNVAVSVKVRNNGLVTTSRTPAQTYDGIHFWVRYQAENSMYYLSANRRDNVVLIKKKVPGGPTNGGTYYTLSSNVSHTVPYGSWQNLKATAKNNSDGSVTISLYAEGVLLVSATDHGTGGPPITAPGKTGLRGDNCNFNFDDFTVDAL
jgi:hypothetical protein